MQNIEAMYNAVKLSVILLILVSLFACNTMQQAQDFSFEAGDTRDSKPADAKETMTDHKDESTDKSDKSDFAAAYSEILGITISESCNHSFIEYISGWIGVPYLYAGESKEGTDCSGFVMNVYQDVFGKAVNRSSAGLHEEATPIDSADMKEGDLVFFKINTAKVGHVGIYISDSYFVHASSSKGVIISRLTETYYKKYFFSAGRIE